MYNYNLFENSAECPNFDNAIKYASLWLDTDYPLYRTFAVNACNECLLSEYSDLSKDNQKRIVSTWNLIKKAD